MVSFFAGVKNYLTENKINAEVVYSAAQIPRAGATCFLFWISGYKKRRFVNENMMPQSLPHLGRIVIGSGMSDENSVRNIQDGNWTSYNDVDVDQYRKYETKAQYPGRRGHC
jgi:hypothetical protein